MMTGETSAYIFLILFIMILFCGIWSWGRTQ